MPSFRVYPEAYHALIRVLPVRHGCTDEATFKTARSALSFFLLPGWEYTQWFMQRNNSGEEDDVAKRKQGGGHDSREKKEKKTTEAK